MMRVTRWLVGSATIALWIAAVLRLEGDMKSWRARRPSCVGC
jgi:hypothetical protein